MNIIILLTPWLLFIALVLTAYCIFKKKKWGTIIMIFVIIVVNWCFRIFPISFTSDTSDVNKYTFKVLTFNINGVRHDSLSIKNVAKLITDVDADIVFVVEDFYNTLLTLHGKLSETYPYINDGYRKSGHYLYSKTPIGTSKRLEDDSHSYMYHYCVGIAKDSVQILGCHLVSNNYMADKSNIHPDSINGIKTLTEYIRNLNRASKIREQEVMTLLGEQSSGDKSIILGDFNDICGSAPLNKIERAGFTDAWWKGGNGYGATIHHPLLYRIDHIFYNKGLKLKSIKKVDSQGLSDHDALVAEFWME